MFTPSALDFLKDLANNNNREWFTENRKRYEAAKKELENVVSDLIKGVSEFQPLPNTMVRDCIFRINRDVRFSKNKDPYKQFLSMAIGPGGRHSGQIDYYLHIQPNNESFLGAGMYNPEPKSLAKFRQELDFNPQSLKSIIEEATFREFYPVIWGEKLVRTPKGYTEDHPDIELLKRKELFFMHKFSDEEITSASLTDKVLFGCKLIKPYCDYLNFLFFEEKEEEIKL